MILILTVAMTGIPSAIIRFACHIPLGIVGFGNLSDWKTISKYPILHHAPYNSSLVPAWHLAGGMVGSSICHEYIMVLD